MLALCIENLRKSYSAGAAPRSVLQGISLQMASGDYIAIMGESGAGKSTLLNLIAGLDVADAGRISIAGQDLAALDDAERTRLRRRSMGFVFQAFHLLPHLSVERNVALPLALNGIDGRAASARVAEMLAAVHLAGRARSYPAELSGGEMQRVAVARALVHKPALVLADEPTGNLDADSAGEVLQLLRDQLKRDGAAGILVTHSSIAAATADRTYRLAANGLSLLSSQPG
ncbi:MAG TPA: ABC transporter ATP-binding protein [Steroidobacteraceae bacterium]|jgi:putative ABC transport system ATP-binding protein